MKTIPTKTRYYKGRARIHLIKQHLPTNSPWNFCNMEDRYKNQHLGKFAGTFLSTMTQYYMKLILNNIFFRNNFFTSTF